MCLLGPQNGPLLLLDLKFYIVGFYVEIFMPLGSLVIIGYQSAFAKKKCRIAERRNFTCHSLELQLCCCGTRPWVPDRKAVSFLRKHAQLGREELWRCVELNILTGKVELKDCIRYLDLLSNLNRNRGCHQSEVYHITSQVLLYDTGLLKVHYVLPHSFRVT